LYIAQTLSNRIAESILSVRELLRELKSHVALHEVELVLEPSSMFADAADAQLAFCGIVRQALNNRPFASFRALCHECCFPDLRLLSSESFTTLSFSPSVLHYISFPQWVEFNTRFLTSISLSRCVIDAKSLQTLDAVGMSALSIALDHVLLDFTSRYRGKPLTWMIIWSNGANRWTSLVALEVQGCGYAKPARLHESYTPISETDMQSSIINDDGLALVRLREQVIVQARQSKVHN
jgi:hypothetical protein